MERDHGGADVGMFKPMRRPLRKTYIREWREKRGLSLRRLADRLETEPGGEPLISHASLGRIETGEQPYSQPILEAVADALGVSVSALLEINPAVEGEVIDLMSKLDDRKRNEALNFLRYLASR